MPRVEPTCVVGSAAFEVLRSFAVEAAKRALPAAELPAWISPLVPELPHERNARLRREAVEGGEVQP